MSSYKIIKPDSDAVCIEAAKNFLRLAQQCVEQKGEFSVALAGGSTPKKFYQILSQPPYSTSIPWGKMRIFFGDERAVPPDHPDSNYGMANQNLFKKISIDPLRVHRIQSELPPEQAAEAYHTILSTFLASNDAGQPVIDLVLLGLGDDGHVASLFPGTDILDIEDKTAAAVWVEKKKSWRISMTLPVINSAEHIWMMVTGESKNDIVDRIFNYPSITDPLPVELVIPHNDVTWYLDEAAANWIR